MASAQAQGIDPDRIRLERFTAVSAATDRPIEVELRRSNKVIQVDANQSVLNAVCATGVAVPSDCHVGNCGTCAVKVLEGSPDHRDVALTQAERERAGLMCICVSRAHSKRLVLDL